MKCLIIASGNLESMDIVDGDSYDYIICADGGTDHIVKTNLIPDLIIGDMDSISVEAREFISKNKIPIMKFPSEKNMTDLELAIEKAYSLSCRHIDLVGATGTRLDHTLANIFLLYKMEELSISGSIIDKNNKLSLLNKDKKVFDEGYRYISIVPITMEGVRVSLIGMKYPLNNHLIEFASTLGVSNELLGQGEIKLHSGLGLVIKSRD